MYPGNRHPVVEYFLDEFTGKLSTLLEGKIEKICTYENIFKFRWSEMETKIFVYLARFYFWQRINPLRSRVTEYNTCKVEVGRK